MPTCTAKIDKYYKEKNNNVDLKKPIYVVCETEMETVGKIGKMIDENTFAGQTLYQCPSCKTCKLI